MVEDFAADNVVYLELRSTPRANPKTGASFGPLEVHWFTNYFILGGIEVGAGSDIKILTKSLCFKVVIF